MAEEHVVTKEYQKDVPSEREFLLGSNVLKSTYPMKDGGVLQLGDIVRLAHKISKLSVKGWNALSVTEREEKLQAALDSYKNEIKGEDDV